MRLRTASGLALASLSLAAAAVVADGFRYGAIAEPGSPRDAVIVVEPATPECERMAAGLVTRERPLPDADISA